METIREKLVNAIVLISEDEFERGDFFNIAKESEEQLIDRLISISIWYKHEYDN
jgi:hypothetical protein